MGLTVVPGNMIEDGTITDTQFDNTTITSADMAVDPRDADNLSSGSVPLAQLGNVPAADTGPLDNDLATLGFNIAATDSLAKYNLVNQIVDAFEDASGVDAGSSTGETRNASNYYAGTGTGPGDATGGTITYSGGNTIHSFTADGNFITESAATLGSYLVVGGGGAGGSSNASYTGGGGGGGGYRTDTSFAVTAQTYSITVGAGGTAAAIGVTGGNGGDSVFSTITSAGGGGGGGGAGTRAGSAGGSGGGSAGNNSSGGGAASPAGQGNAGGSSTTSTRIGSGGGGAGQVGVNGSSPAWLIPYDGVAGGNGTSSSIIGSSLAYGAGGGSGGMIQTGYSPNSATGGAGGASGAGAGSSPSEADPGSAGNGTANRGGGGGGGGGNWDSPWGIVGGAGGSGVVILSYTTNSFTNTTYNNMTLVSTATTAAAIPTKGDMVMTYTNGAGTAVINTNIKGYVSRDGGTTYTQGTLATGNTIGGHTILSFHDLDISGQPSGSSMRYKIETLVQSAALTTRIQAVSLGWS